VSQDGSAAVGVFHGVVALDGPSGTGKSSAARLLARRLGSRYLDTGAMYRTATVAALHAGVDLTDAQAVARTVAAAEIAISTDPEPAVVRLDGVDVSQEIRSAAVTQAVSAVAAVPAVRVQLVAQQRELIGAGGIVVEGRDIGSTVWPDAELKVYLTASPEARALRRAGETGQHAEEVAQSLRRRDRLDSSRSASPLRRADGAVELDTTELTLAEVVQTLASLLDAPP
jgi:cytidylate kinase